MFRFEKALLAGCLIVCAAPLAAAGPLRAGAAKIDITPRASALHPGDTIRDPLFVRALVIGNGRSCAVVVGLDQGIAANEVVGPAIERAAAVSGCAKSNILISATHTHSGSTTGINPGGEPNSRRVENAIVDAVARAAKQMQPARLGFGTAQVNLNTNRDLFADNRWMQGPNPSGPSDKTLAVLEVLDTNGRLIGAYMNYAMHPIDFYLSGVVSADVPGEASRYIERRSGPDAVAIFAQGASGDQNPLLLDPLYKLVAVRTGGESANDDSITGPAPWTALARERNANDRLNATLARPVPAERLAAYREAVRNTGEIVTAMGAMLGESAIETMRYATPVRSDEGVIEGTSESIQCPGRDRLDAANPAREGSLPPYADGAPVTISIGVLRLGDAYIAFVNGEVYSEIAQRLKREAPVSKLMLTTLANGFANSGYIYSDAAASHLTFQVIGSRLKAGCAEDSIVATALNLISRLQRSPL